MKSFVECFIFRLLGIGRNQYIDLMNQTRSKTKFGGFSTSLFRFLTVIRGQPLEKFFFTIVLKSNENWNTFENVVVVLSFNLEMSLKIL